MGKERWNYRGFYTETVARMQGLLRHFTRDRCDIEKLTRLFHPFFFFPLSFSQAETSVYLSF